MPTQPRQTPCRFCELYFAERCQSPRWFERLNPVGRLNWISWRCHVTPQTSNRQKKQILSSDSFRLWEKEMNLPSWSVITRRPQILRFSYNGELYWESRQQPSASGPKSRGRAEIILHAKANGTLICTTSWLVAGAAVPPR